MPEHCVEQRLNASYVERLGIGERIDMNQLNAESIRRFLEHAPTYAENARAQACDGRAEAIDTIQTWVNELPAMRRRGLLVEVPA